MESIEKTVEHVRSGFNAGKTRSLAWREQQLRALRRLLTEREDELLAALQADLGKCAFEGWIAEINLLVSEIDHTLPKLAKWARPKRVSTPLVLKPGASHVYSDPLGVVLVIAPWNYPLQLVLAPMIGAIAAGNACILKPSEVAEATSKVVAKLVPTYMDPDCIAVVEGGVDETTTLLKQRFDHIFYTGNATVGRIVMRAAAEHLTPVTLELGGKSPCYVDRNVDLDVAARRIVWGKFFNAGQTCVAPDYVLAHSSIKDSLETALADTVRTFYGEDPQKSGDYGRIINERHFDRLAKLIESGTPICGGQTDRSKRYIAPTILGDVAEDSAVMQDEIFGPILPILPIDSPEKAITFINAREKPLALYVFSNDTDTQQAILQRTSSGGACVNDTIAHLSVPDLPFGGVGESGMGAYHGKASFDTFSHQKAVLSKSIRMDLSLRYPPYGPDKVKWVRRLA